MSQSKIAGNLRVFREGLAQHDKLNPDHSAWGIGINAFDMDRLGFEDGENLWGDIIIVIDSSCQSGRFKIKCNVEEDHEEEKEEAEATILILKGRNI